MSQARFYVGTSGWNYKHWRGAFYPQGLRQADWLRHFAGEFDTVEVNNAFYRIPTRNAVETWHQQTPGRFRFAVKMWRGVSHYKKMKECREHLEKFFASIAALPTSQRGPILLQLPANQGKDLDKLDRFLTDFKAVTHPDRWKLAVEFRTGSWLCSETYELLDRHRAAVCLHDMPPADTWEANEARFVYVRRHGPSGDYRGNYSDEAIEKDARRIADWQAEGRTVFVYFNNDMEGFAVGDAQRLIAAAGAVA